MMLKGYPLKKNSDAQWPWGKKGILSWLVAFKRNRNPSQTKSCKEEATHWYELGAPLNGDL